MQKAERTQVDGKQPDYSERSGLDCSGSVDRARQEFKDEADTNKLLARYGVGLPLKPVVYGEQDFQLDLQKALEAVQVAKQAYRDLAPEIRRDYPSWQRLLMALENGKLSLDPPKPVPAVPSPGVPPTVPPPAAGA